MGTNYDFTVEKQFTRVYREYHSAPIAVREVKCLEIMYPAVMLPIQPGDRVTGRVRMPLIGFSPEIGGFGYYCHEAVIRSILERGDYSDSEKREMEDILAFWATENSVYKVRAAYPPDMADALPRDDYLGTPMPACPLYRMAGTYIDYAKLLKLGLSGMSALVDEKKTQAEKEGGDVQFFENMIYAIALLAKCCLHYAAQAEALKKATEDIDEARVYADLALALRNISHDRPKTLLEAVQLMWLYTLICGSQNYGRVDDVLGDYLEHDLQSGETTLEQAQLLFNSWWKLMIDRKTTVNGRVIIGGEGRHNPIAADKIAILAMEASRVVCDIEPQLSLRVYKDMAPQLMDKALSVLAEGRTFPILYNDDTNIPAVMKAFRIGREEAQDYVPFGCGEYVINHRSFGTPSGIINLLKVLDMTLRNGIDGLSGQRLGIETGKAEDFKDFDDLWNAYKRQAEHFIDMLARQEELEYRVVSDISPFLYLSMLYDDCLDRGKAIFDGGIRYLGGTIETYGNINTADSLTAIKHVIYDKKLMTIPELIAAMDADFEGYERERKLLQNAPKYGNDNAEADQMAVRVHEHVCNYVRDEIQKINLHSYLVVIINNDTNTTWGRLTPASPDGRKKCGYMANANNPQSGNDKKGLTAMLNSLVKLRPDIHAGAVQNMKLSPELFKGNDCISKKIIETYFDMGGSQAMVSVVRKGDLEQAMIHPENYGHLFVRVGGFSARFVELDKDIQLEIVNRTLY